MLAAHEIEINRGAFYWCKEHWKHNEGDESIHKRLQILWTRGFWSMAFAGPGGPSYIRATLLGTGPRLGKAWSKPMPWRARLASWKPKARQTPHVKLCRFLQLTGMNRWTHQPGAQASGRSRPLHLPVRPVSRGETIKFPYTIQSIQSLQIRVCLQRTHWMTNSHLAWTPSHSALMALILAKSNILGSKILNLPKVPHVHARTVPPENMRDLSTSNHMISEMRISSHCRGQSACTLRNMRWSASVRIAKATACQNRLRFWGRLLTLRICKGQQTGMRASHPDGCSAQTRKHVIESKLHIES